MSFLGRENRMFAVTLGGNGLGCWFGVVPKPAWAAASSESINK